MSKSKNTTLHNARSCFLSGGEERTHLHFVAMAKPNQTSLSTRHVNHNKKRVPYRHSILVMAERRGFASLEPPAKQFTELFFRLSANTQTNVCSLLIRILAPFFRKKKSALQTLYSCYGGEERIRTSDTFPYTRFPSVHIRPL